MCQGDYTPFSDYVRSRVSCVAYTLPALKCILDGVQKIPSPPENVIVDPLDENSLQVSWSPPQRLANRVKSYSINCTVLHSFDDASVANITSEVSVTVSSELDSAVIRGLKPFTMYSISMTSNNEFGSSLPSVRIRTLTLDSGAGAKTTVAVVPKLPGKLYNTFNYPKKNVASLCFVFIRLEDIRGCCISSGMTHRNCVDRLCDPKKADFTQIPDLMVCAPWANISYACLANKIDHSPCCRSRGIPDNCLHFCTGNVTAITVSSFR